MKSVLFCNKKRKAVLSQGEPRDAAVNFDRPTYNYVYRTTTSSCGFRATAQLAYALSIGTKIIDLG